MPATSSVSYIITLIRNLDGTYNYLIDRAGVCISRDPAVSSNKDIARQKAYATLCASVLERHDRYRFTVSERDSKMGKHRALDFFPIELTNAPDRPSPNPKANGRNKPPVRPFADNELL